MLKKWCAVLLAAAILVASAISASAAGYLRGDTDDDGVVTILDATLIQRVMAGLRVDENGYVAKRGKITGTSLSVMDATAIQRYLACFDDPYAIGTTVTDDGDEFELPII